LRKRKSICWSRNHKFLWNRRLYCFAHKSPPLSQVVPAHIPISYFFKNHLIIKLNTQL
jgi:hypothetical protein